MSVVENIEFHPLYGEIKIKTNPRARNIILRARGGFIEVTLPLGAGRSDLMRALATHGEKLLAECRKNAHTVINSDYKYENEGFCFNLLQSPNGRSFLRCDGVKATLYYSENIKFSDDKMQESLRGIRATALHRVAKGYLPQRLEKLAAKHGFSYNSVSLRDTHTRWGSCSSRKSISLSIYLQLLPTHLSDYVMLHELCHTVEMNHKEPFWELMNKVTDGKAKQLRSELKKYKPAF